jgi:hypothetical protein
MTAPDRPELPPPDTALVDVDVDEDALTELRRRADEEGVAPEDDERLLRYLVYLGAAYIRAERVVEGGTADAFGLIRANADASKSGAASLRFAYGEAVRADGTSRRAIVAEEHFLGSFADALATMEAEVEARRARIQELEAAVDAR